MFPGHWVHMVQHRPLIWLSSTADTHFSWSHQIANHSSSECCQCLVVKVGHAHAWSQRNKWTQQNFRNHLNNILKRLSLKQSAFLVLDKCNVTHLWCCQQEPATEATPALTVWSPFSGDDQKSSTLVKQNNLWTYHCEIVWSVLTYVCLWTDEPRRTIF